MDRYCWIVNDDFFELYKNECPTGVRVVYQYNGWQILDNDNEELGLINAVSPSIAIDMYDESHDIESTYDEEAGKKRITEFLAKKIHQLMVNAANDLLETRELFNVIQHSTDDLAFSVSSDIISDFVADSQDSIDKARVRFLESLERHGFDLKNW